MLKISNTSWQSGFWEKKKKRKSQNDILILKSIVIFLKELATLLIRKPKSKIQEGRDFF